jgi:hypothetical protein
MFPLYTPGKCQERKIIVIQFEFAYSEKSRNEAWIATGKRGPAKGTVKVDELTLTPEQRAVIVPFLAGRWQGCFIGNLTDAIIELKEYHPEPTLGGSTEPTVKSMTFDTAPSLDDILAILPKMHEEYQQAKSEVVKLVEQRKREAEEKKRRDQEFKALQEAAEEADKQQRLAERATWIAAHGSERLRKCQKRGYDCARLYLIERAAVEYPGFVLDYNDSGDWNPRKGPSLEALKREEELAELYPYHEIAIVWLIYPPSNAPDQDEDAYGFEPHEAIVMHPPVGSPYGDHLWLVQDI